MVIIWLMMVNNLVGGWATNPSEKYEFVSWDDEIPIYGKNMFQTTNQR